MLLIGYGNPGRLDDGLGPALAAAVRQMELDRVTVESCYQLAVEHAEQAAHYDVVDLCRRRRSNGAGTVSIGAARAERWTWPSARTVWRRQRSWGSPSDLFQATTDGYVLGIRGYEFDDFGEQLSPRARENLAAAAEFLEATLQTPTVQGRTMKDGKYVIQYVEDDADYRDSMRTVLEANGYHVIEAASGEEGLRQFKAEQPDLVILDLMMEEVDTGTAMVRDLKMAGCTAPVIVTSSAGDALHMSTDYAELGLAGVLQKPVDFDLLLALIRSKLQQ